MPDRNEFEVRADVATFAMVPLDLLGRVSAMAVMVWCALWKFTDAKARSTYVSQKRVAQLLGVNQGTVSRAVRELEGTGRLKVHRTFEGTRARNTYTLLMQSSPRKRGDGKQRRSNIKSAGRFASSKKSQRTRQQKGPDDARFQALLDATHSSLRTNVGAAETAFSQLSDEDKDRAVKAMPEYSRIAAAAVDTRYVAKLESFLKKKKFLETPARWREAAGINLSASAAGAIKQQNNIERI